MPPRKPSAVGSHVPTSGGLLKALAYGREIGAGALRCWHALTWGRRSTTVDGSARPRPGSAG